ncbi:hypothetical protein CgunFtcFv8_024743 [Champsocephalus gunnari]|uniref:Uncharacterized protein n=2 Tax=Champsocephalus gunnari TaxID=52237 RepID=A0AAN8DF18_CHAGU|nr:hypothetical protein CgunFtcFv8_024743 [Champsocephalus gunnari]
MTAFSKPSLMSQNGNSRERQTRELQHAIQENKRKLVDVQQKRLRAEEDIIHCKREMKKRAVLMVEKHEVVDALVTFGHLLQDEKHLSEQLNGQASADRNDLQERSERITNKATSLAAEILEVKERLAEAKAHNIAAQALIQTPTTRSKRN